MPSKTAAPFISTGTITAAHAGRVTFFFSLTLFGKPPRVKFFFTAISKIPQALKVEWGATCSSARSA